MNQSSDVMIGLPLAFSVSTLPPAISSEIDDSNRATIKLSFAIAYLVLFVVGVIGNVIVIVMIGNVLTSMRRQRTRRSHSSTSHVFVYVLGLSIVDLLVILHLPFLVVDLLKGSWLFGEGMCRLYWFGESVNKLLSSFLMMVLSWDRYLAVCSPVRSMRIRSNSVAVAVLLMCSLLAVVLLLPVLIQASVVKIDRIKMIPLPEGSTDEMESDLRGTTVAKCMFDSDAVFVLYTFFIGFFLPAVFITLFYVQVIYRLHVNTKNMGSSKSQKSEGPRSGAVNRVQQVTKRIVAVIVFYFFCWTPQWTLNMMSQFNLIHPTWVTPALSSIFLCAHVLVCFNSAVNPVLYALINRELRAQHVAAMARKRQSITAATQVAIEFVVRHTYKSALSIPLFHLFCYGAAA